MSVVLQVDDLHFAYAGAAPLFDGWSAALGPGLAWLYGESGAGKTTLLRLLAAQEPMTSGRMQVAGHRFNGDGDEWRSQVCWLDPARRDDDALSVEAFVAQMQRGYAGFDAPQWRRHAQGFGLADHLGKRFEQLSTGSRRKVWIATSLASGAPLVLLDEPTAALDRPSITYLRHALSGRRGAADGLCLVASFERPGALAVDAELSLSD